MTLETVEGTTYALHAVLADGTSGLVPVSSLAWEEQPGELATRIALEFPDVEVEQGWLSQLVRLGTPVTVLSADVGQDFVEVARGTVWDFSPPDGQGGTFSVTAYDTIQRLHHTKFDDWYPSGMTPGALIRAVCAKFEVPLGAMDDALESVTFGAQSIRGKTPASCILDWLQQAREAGTPRLVTRSTQGRLEIVRPGAGAVGAIEGPEATVNTQPTYWIQHGVSSLGVTQHLSLGDLVTRVVVYGKAEDNAASPLVATLDGSTGFGVWQDILYLTEHKTPDEVEAATRVVLNEKGAPRDDRSVTAPDRPRLRKFDRVRVTDGALDGVCVVEGVSHDADARKMQLTLGNLQVQEVEGVFTLVDEGAIPPVQTKSTAGTTGGTTGGNTLGSATLDAAIKPWLGVPYLFGGGSKQGVDCSAFTQAVFSAMGVSIPRTAEAQRQASTPVSTPQVGDLVFFANTYATPGASHVGIYVGGGKMVSAAGAGVGTQDLGSAYWRGHFMAYGRVK